MKKRLTALVLVLTMLMSTLAGSVSAATNPYTLTGDMAYDMANVALAQKGKKNADFSGMPKAAWCAYFVCWCANQTGASSAGILPTKYTDCGTTGQVAYWVAKKKTGWVYVFTDKGKARMETNASNGNWSKVSQSSYTPQVGDVVLFRWSGAASTTAFSHVAIVYKVTDTTLYYVDGNGTSGTYAQTYVTTHTIQRTDSQIVGYIHPYYTDSSSNVSTISLTTDSYTNLTNTSVRLLGACSYTGTKPSSVGLYLGTSSTNMTKVDSDTISHSKNPFDIWYDVTNLTAGTTYYWRLYAIVNGKEVLSSGGIQTFTTTGTAPSKTYNVYVSSGVHGGTVSVSPTSAKEGTTVTIRTTPSSGYSTGIVVYVSDTTLSIPSGSSGTYTFTMPASDVTVDVDFWEMSTELINAAKNPFVDVDEDDYFYNAVVWAVENNITLGSTATTFSPEENCTRAQIVTFLWRSAGSPTPSGGENPFTDVREGEYYYDAVLWAVENNITLGTSPTTFSPEESCTRAQAVTFLYRVAGEPETAAETEIVFTDVKTTEYYYDAVLWAVQQGITNGMTETTFSPEGICTRAQIVTFLSRAYTSEE